MANNNQLTSKESLEAIVKKNRDYFQARVNDLNRLLELIKDSKTDAELIIMVNYLSTDLKLQGRLLVESINEENLLLMKLLQNNNKNKKDISSSQLEK
jgi:hypothetical protein